VKKIHTLHNPADILTKYYQVQALFGLSRCLQLIIALRGSALWGTTLRGSMAILVIEDFSSKVEIVEYE